MKAQLYAGPSLSALLKPAPLRRNQLAILIAAALAVALITLLGLPLWASTAVFLALLAPPALKAWRAVGERFGVPLMILSILLYLQGFHTIEHIVQFIEFHLFNWPPRLATGLLSGLNVEIVHFVWNWSVLLVAVYLMRSGLRSGPRNLYGWLFLGWALAHTLEHTYLMYQYLSTVRALSASGASLTFAEGLPGVLGRGGWLDKNAATNTLAGFVCRLVPGNQLTPRLDVHFWWNVGETVLMIGFAKGALLQLAPGYQRPAAIITVAAAEESGTACNL